MGGGYYGYENVYSTPQAGTAPPDYLGDPIEFSGSGADVTDTFSRENEGPLVIEIETENSREFLIQLYKEQTGELTNIYGGVGGSDTTQIHDVDTGEYVIRVRQDPGDWSLTVKDYPAINTSHRQAGQPPIKTEGQGVEMVGPLALAPDKRTNFTFEAESNGRHLIEAYDTHGIYQQNILEITPSEDLSQTTSMHIGGTGYLLINSATKWELSVTSSSP